VKKLNFCLLGLASVAMLCVTTGEGTRGESAPVRANTVLHAATPLCGDADGSGSVDIGDVIFIFNYIFADGPAPDPPELADENCDGAVNLIDCTTLVAYLFSLGGSPPCCITEAEYCPRNYGPAFDMETALQMARLSAEAYHIGSGLQQGQIIRNCWEAIKFIQSDSNFICDAPQVPGQNDTQLYLVRDPWTNDIAVVFRGTESIPDWFTDAQFALPVDFQFDDGTVVPNSVHRGFYCAYESVKAELKSTLAAAIAQVPDHSTAHIYFTGHSLGAALTELAAMDLSSWLVDNYGYQRDNVIMYSIAAPLPFKPNLLSYFRQRVPHSYSVMERTDPVPYVPMDYERIDSIVVLNSALDANGNVTDTRMEFENGADIGSCGPAIKPCPASYGAAGHNRDKYITRLEDVRDPGVPNISVDVHNGKMRLNWSGVVQGPCDRVKLCKSCPDYISDFNPLSTDWEWVVKGSSQQTQEPKSEGYQAAYVNSFGEVLAKSAPYVSPPPSRLTITREVLGGVTVTWKMSQEGEYDYVALYKQNPATAGPNGYVATKKHLVYTDLFDHWGTTLFGGPIWVAYVTSDALVGGHRRILKIAGPIN